MSDYNPFAKPIDELHAEDLTVLKSVAEGWYVEYKSELVSASNIAKSISAFANTYGGWLFFGIAEKAKDDPVAGNFVGIEKSQIDLSLQRIRNAASQCLNPAPHYEVTTLLDESGALSMGQDKALIVLRVPQGSSAPYVHNSGRIFRRVGDSSDPVPETDRFVLDQLWKRGDEHRKSCREWINRDLELSKGEEEQPYFRLFLSPDLWDDKQIRADFATQTVRDILGAVDKSDSLFTTPFDCVYRTNAGFVGRQASGNDPHRLSGTWFLSHRLESEIIFPLPTLKSVRADTAFYELDGYEHADKYGELLAKYGHSSANVIDLNFLFASLNGVFHTYAQLGELAGYAGPWFAKAELINVWRHRPFLDVPMVIEQQEKFGVPVCMSDQLFAPLGDEPEDFREITLFEHIPEVQMRKFLQAMHVFEPVAASLGIETGLSELAKAVDNEEPEHIYVELMEAAKRAQTAQKLRNSRITEGENW